MSDDNQTAATGSCLCGAVRYSVHAPIDPDVTPCHCSQCRKQSGHFAAYVAVERWDAVAIEGADSVTWYSASERARRGFCKVCGSQLFWVPADRASGDVSGGTLDAHPPLRLGGHIFVADKGAYYEINDPVPLHPRYPEDAGG